MPKKELPVHFASVRQRFPRVIEALEKLGKAAREQGPLDNKMSNLIQLAAAAAIQSEGAVHSHVRRAVAAGATPDEVYHVIVLLVRTVGFPKVAAALSWVDDVLKKSDADSH